MQGVPANHCTGQFKDDQSSLTSIFILPYYLTYKSTLVISACAYTHLFYKNPPPLLAAPLNSKFFCIFLHFICVPSHYDTLLSNFFIVSYILCAPFFILPPPAARTASAVITNSFLANIAGTSSLPSCLPSG